MQSWKIPVALTPSKAPMIFYQHSLYTCCCILRISLRYPDIFKTPSTCMCMHTWLYAIGKAIDNSQPCVRGSRKCETMFVNNSRANSWQQRLCGKPEAKWFEPTTGIYPVYSVVRTPIWINILFEFDTICFARWAIVSRYINDRLKLDCIFCIG